MNDFYSVRSDAVFYDVHNLKIDNITYYIYKALLFTKASRPTWGQKLRGQDNSLNRFLSGADVFTEKLIWLLR